MARPPTKIDWDKVDNMLKAHCQGTEIAGHLGISVDTLYRACQRDNSIGFAEYSHQKKSVGKALLRLKQYNEAMNGDRGMLIWLGKNILKQTDKQDVNHSGGTQLTVVNFSEIPQKPWKDENQPQEEDDE